MYPRIFKNRSRKIDETGGGRGSGFRCRPAALQVPGDAQKNRVETAGILASNVLNNYNICKVDDRELYQQAFELAGDAFFIHDYQGHIHRGNEPVVVHGYTGGDMSERAPRVLIVDDVPENIQISATILKSEGYDLFFAESGERALQEARSREIDLMLLDIMMPGMDGITVCRELMKDEGTRDIPVVFLTALGDTEHIEKAFSAGGVDYVIKPIRWQELVARVRTHLRLRMQNRELEDLNATKDKLFSIIAHDLKNPFNSIIGLANLAKEEYRGGEEDELEEYLEMISRSAHQGFELLENLLQWSRAQTKRIEFNPQMLDLCYLTEQALDLLRQEAQKKELALSNEIEKGTMVYGDYQMLHFIVRNLVSNAVKFTSVGGRVRIAAESSGDEVRLSVEDSGTGIEPEDRERLFRLDTAVTRSGTAGERGTGLGLVVCKEFVDTHGGEIEVSSAPGEGTRFDLHFPQRQEEEPDTDGPLDLTEERLHYSRKKEAGAGE